ncbi:MAG: RIP metalloprotease RseP [Anaerolineaceae bacterium]|nr:RIP metalloprotease RseP [Anaerolineaceae bacterium]
MLEGLFQNEFLMSILAFALVLIPAIIIHELGHFIAAKLAGISVLEFAIGWPPRMVKLFRWGETEIVLNWLPIGGYVLPLGEDMAGPVAEDEADEEEDEKPKHQVEDMRQTLRERGVADEDMVSVQDASAGARIFFMAAGALANVLSAIVLFIIVALLGLPEVVGARSQVVSLETNSVFAQAGVTLGDVVERVDGELFQSTPEFVQQLINGSGNVTLDMIRYETGEPYTVTVNVADLSLTAGVHIRAVSLESPADEAGLKPGDVITHIDGTPIDFEDPSGTLIEMTIARAGTPMALSYLRDGEQLVTTLIPRVNPPEGEGRMGIAIESYYTTADGVSFVPSVPQEKMIPQTLDKAIAYGFNQTGEIIGTIITLPKQLIDGTISPEEARPVSVVGISRIGAEFLQRSISEGAPGLILNFIAMVSIFLGVTNLLPVPPLDGGRILFVLIEIVRGKPVPIRIEAMIIRIGLYIILALAVLVIIYDIINPFTIPG